MVNVTLAFPLLLVVTRANRHDVSQIEVVPDIRMVGRFDLPVRRRKHLRADAGYTEAPDQI